MVQKRAYSAPQCGQQVLIDRLVVLAWLVTTSAGEQRLIVPLLPNLKYSQPEIRHDLRALPGAENAPFEPLYAKNDHFAKTGSGQT